MKNLINYLNAPSCIYKYTTKGAVILTYIICTLMFLVVALAESYPFTALLIASLMGVIVYLIKSSNEKNINQNNR